MGSILKTFSDNKFEDNGCCFYMNIQKVEQVTDTVIGCQETDTVTLCYMGFLFTQTYAGFVFVVYISYLQVQAYLLTRYFTHTAFLFPSLHPIIFLYPSLTLSLTSLSTSCCYLYLFLSLSHTHTHTHTRTHVHAHARMCKHT